MADGAHYDGITPTGLVLTLGSIFLNILTHFTKTDITFWMSVIVFALACANHITSIIKNRKK